MPRGQRKLKSGGISATGRLPPTNYRGFIGDRKEKFDYVVIGPSITDFPSIRQRTLRTLLGKARLCTFFRTILTIHLATFHQIFVLTFILAFVLT
jgi:hypothetical protein